MPDRRFSRRWLFLSAAIGVGVLVTLLFLFRGGPYLHAGEPVLAVAFSPNGQLIAAASTNGVQLWRLADRHLIRTLGPGQGSSAVAWSPNGQFVATEGPGYTVRIWRVADGSQVVTLAAHRLPIGTLTFSPDGSLLASASGDGTVRFWHMPDGTPVQMLEGHTTDVDDVAFSPDGRTIALLRRDGTIGLWRRDDERRLPLLNGIHAAHLVFSPDGRWLATSLMDTITVWRIADGTAVARLQHGDHVTRLAFSPDGRLLAASAGGISSDGPKDMSVRLWRLQDGRLINVIDRHTSVVMSIAFSPDGHTLATGSWDETVGLWDVPDLEGSARRPERSWLTGLNPEAQ